MGYLVEGVWKDLPRDTRKTGGEFIRPESVFRDRVTADGSSGFKAEAGRYHLYVSLACPWAHRTVIFRKLKGLEKAISLRCRSAMDGTLTFSERPADSPQRHRRFVLYDRPPQGGRPGW
jgi:glutathionyl-hydroquinone reductase